MFDIQYPVLEIETTHPSPTTRSPISETPPTPNLAATVTITPDARMPEEGACAVDLGA